MSLNTAPVVEKTARPLIEQLRTFRVEAKGTLSELQSVGLGKEVIERYRQNLDQFSFWYGQWDLNRDYSSVVNASLALGKLDSATVLFSKMPGYMTNRKTAQIIEETNKIISASWEAIQKATSRLVPFNE